MANRKRTNSVSLKPGSIAQRHYGAASSIRNWAPAARLRKMQRKGIQRKPDVALPTHNARGCKLCPQKVPCENEPYQFETKLETMQPVLCCCAPGHKRFSNVPRRSWTKTNRVDLKLGSLRAPARSWKGGKRNRADRNRVNLKPSWQCRLPWHSACNLHSWTQAVLVTCQYGAMRKQAVLQLWKGAWKRNRADRNRVSLKPSWGQWRLPWHSACNLSGAAAPLVLVTCQYAAVRKRTVSVWHQAASARLRNRARKKPYQKRAQRNFKPDVKGQRVKMQPSKKNKFVLFVFSSILNVGFHW